MFAQVPASSDFSYFRWLHSVLPEPFFNTPAFLGFFVLVAAVYWIIPRRWNTLRVCWLVLASFHFYAAWSFELAFLVLGTTVVDYLLARAIEAAKERKLKLGLLLTSLTMNLGLLAYFKYKNFFLESLNEGLGYLGAEPAFATLKMMIPFGISFYTFEAISYAVDVYRGKIRAERSLPHFLLFILFFPHLVAGPIVRAGDFLRQAHRPKRWNWLRVQTGVQFFLLGLFKKLAIADRLAIFTDGTAGDGPWFHPGNFSTGALWLAVLAYSIRIYADFSGYTDMALGLAHLLGYKLTTNFNLPYLALNVADFWKRWHISLSSWLRDYLYIPLGGNRNGAWATRRNLMITMLLGGLWHGAAWSYIIWGALHGLFLIVHRQFAGFCETRPKLKGLLDSKLGLVLRIGTTFFWVTMAWIFFRPDLQGAWEILSRMFVFSKGQSLALSDRSLWWTVGFVFTAMILWRTGAFPWLWARMNPIATGLGYALCLSFALLLAPVSGKMFIYFTF